MSGSNSFRLSSSQGNHTTSRHKAPARPECDEKQQKFFGSPTEVDCPQISSPISICGKSPRNKSKLKRDRFQGPTSPRVPSLTPSAGLSEVHPLRWPQHLFASPLNVAAPPWSSERPQKPQTGSPHWSLSGLFHAAETNSYRKDMVGCPNTTHISPFSPNRPATVHLVWRSRAGSKSPKSCKNGGRFPADWVDIWGSPQESQLAPCSSFGLRGCPPPQLAPQALPGRNLS